MVGVYSSKFLRYIPLESRLVTRAPVWVGALLHL